jgi:membrane protein DedA with SNARE-associated domain
MASVTGSFTSLISQQGVLAVFGLMFLDALLPVGGELVMIYAGVVAAGAAGGQHAGFLGHQMQFGLETYVVLAVAGSIGYLLGSVTGWVVGVRGGRPLIERHGRLLHLSGERFARAERWFARHGEHAVLLGRITPLVRSFISIPAGVLGIPLGRYVMLSLLGSLGWCFAFAGVGWAFRDSWAQVHDGFRNVDYAVVAILVAAVGLLVARRHAFAWVAADRGWLRLPSVRRLGVAGRARLRLSSARHVHPDSRSAAPSGRRRSPGRSRVRAPRLLLPVGEGRRGPT